MEESLTGPGETPPREHREVMQLHPPPARPRRLDGLYLNERMPPPAAGAPAMVYANFVTSLDGRIALTDADGASRLPDGLTNPRDWRLFQELQAHADCLVTHGGYLRAFASGRLGNVLQAGLAAGSEDIARWREMHAAVAQPAIAVVSASLDLPIPDSLLAHRQPVHVLTTAGAGGDRRAALEGAGYDVRGHRTRTVGACPGRGRGSGRARLRRLYLQTGPRMLESALRDRVLARLYLTISHRLAGGERFDTMVRGGAPLGAAGRLRLGALYLDEAPGLDCGQLFARFDAA